MVTVIGSIGSTSSAKRSTPRSRSNKIAPLKHYIELQKGKPIKDSTAKKAFKKNVLLTTSSDDITPLDYGDHIPRTPSNESLVDSTSTVPPPINQAHTPVFRRRSKKVGALEQSQASPSIIEALIHRLSRRRVVPWIGAGVTYNIYGGWEGVVKLLWEEAGQLDDYERARITEDLTVLAQFGCSNLKMQGKDMWSSIEHKFKEFEKKAAHIAENEDKHISANPNAADNSSESSSDSGSVTSASNGRKKKRNNDNQKSTTYSLLDTTLQDLQPLVCGPWPALLTTNWDAMLEQSYQAPWISKSSSNEVKISKFALREGTHLPVRFREDVHLFYAELKSQRRPPMLLKLHGDFTERGRKELVLSHADYRAVMVRDISLNELLRQMSSEYSFLFIGTSLRDRDLLGILDEVSEGLGGGIGPHFWLTPDEVSPTRVQHLQMNFNIQTIHFDPSLPFVQRVKLTNKALKEIAALGWVAPTPQMPYFLQNKSSLSREEKKVYDGVNFSPFKKIVIPVGDFAQVRILNQIIDSKSVNGHVAASVGVVKRQNRYLLANVFGSQVLASLLRHDRKKLEDLHLLNGALGVDVPKYGGVKRMGTINSRFQLWLLCGTEATGGGSPGRIFKAVKSFLKHGIKCYEQGSVVDKHGNKRLKFSLPLLASGGGHTTSKLSLCATLSAIGYFLGTKFKGLPDDSGVTGIDIDIYIALKNEHNPNNVLADISEGRLKPHAIMASSSKAMMHFRVIHIKLNEHHIVRQVWMRIDGTIADLMKELGIALAQSWDIELRLGSGRYARVCQITEQELDQPLFKWGIAEEALIKVSTRFKGFKPTREEYNSDKEDDTSASEEAQI